MQRSTALPGLLFVAAAAALAGLTLGHLTLVTDMSRTGYDHGGFELGPERAVYAESVVMHPGDRLVVRPDRLATPFTTFSSYDFYVVKGGDRYRLLDENATQPVYAQVTGISTGSCCANGWVVFDRPDDETYYRPPRPPVETGPGIEVDMRELVLSGTDQPERIDLVWVFHYREGVAPPEDPQETRRLASRLAAEMRGPFGPQSPTVYQATAVALTPWTYAGMAIAALVAAGAAVAWALRLRRGGVPAADPAATPAEELLRLHGAAGAYLASLRDLLVGMLVVTLLVALHVSLAGEPEEALAVAERAQMGMGLLGLVLAALAVLYAVAAAAWALTFWHVVRALRRWRRRSASAPALDLDADLPDAG